MIKKTIKKTAAAKKAAPVKKATEATKVSKPVEKKEITIINSPFWNILDAGKSYKVKLLIAGLSKKDISVSANGNQLTISCMKESKDEKNEKNYIIKQYSFKSWSKSISLPEKINEKDIKINYKDGVLKIKLNKL